MNKLILLTGLLFSFVFQSTSQITLSLTAGTPPSDLKITASLTSNYNGNGLTGYFFILRSPVSNGNPSVILGNSVAGLGLSSPDLQVVSSQTNGGFYYQMYESNAAGTLPVSWVNSATVDLISIDLTGGTGLAIFELANDPTSDAMIDAYYGSGAAGAVFGSDVIISGTPTVTGFGTNMQPVLLPISLKSFSASKHTEKSSLLNWTTSSEINSDFFGIERSIDGKEWSYIGSVKAAGNSSTERAYDFIDNNLPLNRNVDQVFYYRLQMVDTDGKFKYSDIRGVNFGKVSLGPISIYPNPTTEMVNIDLSAIDMNDGDVFIHAYDMNGRLVIQKKIIGNGLELINLDKMASGSYNFAIRQGEQIFQQKIIKID